MKQKCSIYVFLVIIHCSLLYGQEGRLAGSSINIETEFSDRPGALSCTPPSAVTYVNNAVFYCTGLPITPNTLSYSGSPATSITISPDLPVGLSFDLATGTISGTPTVSRAGNHTIIVVNPCGFSSRVLYISVSSGTNYYLDADADGYGSGAATVSCTGPPANSVDNNTDCAPADPAKWKSSNLFVDRDLDTYSNGFPASLVCYGGQIPSGFTAVYKGTDCDDSKADVNPNATEILANGIDDNCDGIVDEVTTTSSLVPGSCGVTIPNLSTSLFAQAITGAQAYRFQVTNGGDVGVFETTLNRFSLLDITPGVTFSASSTVNTVKVSVKTGGFWRPYGVPCTVTTPPVPNSTSISDPRCGSFLRDIWDPMYCYQVPGANAYRFRVKLGSTVIGTVDKIGNSFNMVDIGINNIIFGTTYSVDVLLKINGVWLSDAEYGIPCSITTPPTPSFSKISIPSCGSSTNSLWQSIFAVPITGAQGYKFVFDNGIRHREYVTSASSMSIQNIPGGPMRGTTYTIRVDVLYNNSYVIGVETCTLTILPTATRMAREPVENFDVVMSPNPFTDHFDLRIEASGEEAVDISVHDLFGRVVAVYHREVDQLNDLVLGDDLASGVYHLVVSQGLKRKTLRVIKR